MPRASWRGYMRLSLVSCPIYLSPATVRTKPIRLHQVWRATAGDALGDLSDRDKGRDVLERPPSLLLPEEVEDRLEQVAPATRITLRPHDPSTGGGPNRRRSLRESQEGLIMPATITRAPPTFEKGVGTS
jgi:hypothetical protein